MWNATESSARDALLMNVAEMRADLARAAEPGPVLARLDRFVAVLAVLGRLPRAACRHYSPLVLSAGFELIADLEESPDLDETSSRVLEASIWDVIQELGRPEVPPERAQFISKRTAKLRANLERRAQSAHAKLPYLWASLLRPRTERIRQFPGLFREDVTAVVDVLVEAGLPRRAKAIATKFQVQVSQVALWTIANRPESEEEGRSRKLVGKLLSPPDPLPYGVVLAARSLAEVLGTPPSAMPLIVGGHGTISIQGRTYGFTG